MISLKKALLILLTFSVLFIAFITGYGFIVAAFIIPYVIYCYNGALCLFSSKLLTSLVISIVGAISIVPIYNISKKIGLWVKGKYKKVKKFFKKRFGKKKDMETQTEQLEYPDPHRVKSLAIDDVEE